MEKNCARDNLQKKRKSVKDNLTENQLPINVTVAVKEGINQIETALKSEHKAGTLS